MVTKSLELAVSFWYVEKFVDLICQTASNPNFITCNENVVRKLSATLSIHGASSQWNYIHWLVLENKISAQQKHKICRI